MVNEMTPPKAPDQTDGTLPSAASSCAEATPDAPAPAKALATLTKRAEFLRAARGDKQGTASMMVQGHARHDDRAGVRVGFTCSKKSATPSHATVPSGVCAKPRAL